MEFGSLILDPATAFPAAAAAALAGAVIWWLVRKRQKRIWLPTIRIMELESRNLPRLVLRMPPLLSFLCFLLCALVMTAFALRPRSVIFTPFEPNQSRIHIFADMSPSVSAQISLDDYVRQVAELYTSLREKGRVTLSTSHGPEVREPESAEAAAAFLRDAGFHRAGIRLGAALKILLEDLGETDRLFIVSDRDAHSWAGFNWRYLLDEMDVKFLDLAGGKEPANLFINDVRYLSGVGGGGVVTAGIMEWDVEIARRADQHEARGKLIVSYMGKALGEFPWQMAAGKQRQSVRAEWPQALLQEMFGKDAAAGVDDDIPLVFRLEVDGGEELTADNEFRTRLLGLRQDVLLVSETAGERALEDPTEQLGTALEVLGFKLNRFDYLLQPGPALPDYPFVILAGGTGSGVDRFCPRSFETARHDARSRQGARAGGAGRSPPAPKIWLMPHTLDADYGELCECYARLMVSRSGDKGKPEFCEHITTRQGWIDLLPSLGAKQIGGELGNVDTTIAWHQRDGASGLEVLAFTIPLTPLKATGINHAFLPVLVKQLATWQGLIEARGGVAEKSWPRLDDLVEKTWRPAVPLEPGELQRVRQSNVPLGESLLAKADPNALPPRWSAQVDWSDQQTQAKKDREDPLPWLRRAVLAVLAATLLEGVVLLVMKVTRILLRRPETVALLLVVLAGAVAERAQAKVEFNLVGYPGAALGGSPTMAMLAREVSHRTSIELATRPNLFGQLTPEALAEPWLFVSDAREIAGANGRLKPEVALWVKRGGFLVVEAPLPQEALVQLTAGLAAEAMGSEGWMPLPPDHELMRSFYLLDALPSCNSQIWRGFHYDGRLAILTIPYAFLASVRDRGEMPAGCVPPPDQERSVRIFVNLIMVALATDYKKDQIHLPEILKRLR